MSEKEIWDLYMKYVVEKRLKDDIPYPKELRDIDIFKNKYFIEALEKARAIVKKDKNEG